MKKKICLWLFLTALLVGLFGCGAQGGKESWKVKDYKKLKDIISVDEVEEDGTENITTYKVKYKSDDCEVVSYLSIPNACLENKEAYPCIIYNRGGNRNYGAITPKLTANMAEGLGKIVFASQYRGVDGGTGKEEFGGADVNDVIKLIDLCEEFSFVDMENLYMIGVSRGGMMTYQAIRQDERIKKAVVGSGVSDVFMWYEERADVRGTVLIPLIGGTPELLPEEYEKRSATYWADELKCPVLIIHSKLDTQVSYEEAEKMVQCLEDAGMEYKFVSYEDDVHGFHQEDVKIIKEWFE